MDSYIGEKRKLFCGVPKSEVVLRASLSSGKGGQNVNKTSTRIELRWRPDDSQILTAEEKGLVKSALHHRLTINNEVVIFVESERSQFRNREIALERLNELVRQALVPRLVRKKTNTPRREREKRLSEKRVIKERKEGRRKIAFE